MTLVIEGCAVATVDPAGTEHATGTWSSTTAGSSRSGPGPPPPTSSRCRRASTAAAACHARAGQHPPPPVPVGDPRPGPAGRPCSSGSPSSIRSGRGSTRRWSARPPRPGWPGWPDRAAPPPPTTTTCSPAAAATCSAPLWRPPARSACGSTRPAARWTSAGPRAACRRTRSWRRSTRSWPRSRTRSTPFHDPSPGAMVRVALAPCSPFSVTADLLRESAEAGPRPRRPAAHPPGRDPRRGGRTAEHLRLHAGGVPGPARLARRRRVAGPRRAPRDAARSPGSAQTGTGGRPTARRQRPARRGHRPGARAARRRRPGRPRRGRCRLAGGGRLVDEMHGRT